MSRTVKVPPMMQIKTMIMMTVTASSLHKTSMGAVSHRHTGKPPVSVKTKEPGTMASRPSTRVRSKAPPGTIWVRMPAPTISKNRMNMEEKKDFLLICSPDCLFSFITITCYTFSAMR